MIHVVWHGNFTEYIRMNCWEVTEKEGVVWVFFFFNSILFNSNSISLKSRKNVEMIRQDIKVFDFREASG